MRIIFWGTGNTAEKCISQINKLSNQLEVVAFTDGRERDNEDIAVWKGYKLISPQMIEQFGVDYICILSVYEWEIRQRIYEEKLFDLSKIISFHELCMMESWGTGIDSCYEKIQLGMRLMQRETAERWRIYEYLKKTYSYVLCDEKYWRGPGNKKVYFEKGKKPIWILWLQGFEQAPDIVKVCIHSIKRILEKDECICLLDQRNLFDYIDLPDHIIEKWKKGIISNTHLSDFIRVRLLNIYGGIWMDATLYFTGKCLPDYIKNSELFMFSIYRNWKICEAPMIAASWLIVSEPENEMLMVLEAALNEYWKKENTLLNYCLIHIFWTLIAERFPEKWDRVERILRDPARLLGNELAYKFNEERFQHLKRMSDVHKLSYKGVYVEQEEGSFWDKLCEIEGWKNA